MTREEDSAALAIPGWIRECAPHSGVALGFLRDGVFVHASPRLVELLDRPRDGVLGRSLRDFVDPPRHEDLAAQEERLSETEGIQFETRLRHDDGPARDVRLRLRALPDGGVVVLVRDITRRAAAEIALRAADTRFRDALAALTRGVSLWQPEDEGKTFRLVELNAAGERLEGVDRDAVLGREPVAVFGSAAPSLARVIARVWTEGVRERFEVTTRAGPVRVRRLAGYASRLRDGSVLIEHEDVTTSREAERLELMALELSRSLNLAAGLEPALETILDAILGLEAIDHAGIALLDPESGALDLAARRDLPEGVVRAVEGLEVGTFRLDGHPSTAVIPVLHQSETVAVLIVGSSDLEEIPPGIRASLEMIASTVATAISRARSEEERRQSDEGYRALFTNAPDGVAITSLSGTILAVNRNLARMLGRVPEEMVGMAISDITPPEYHESEARALAALLERRGPGRFEKEIRHRDGHRVPVAITGWVIEDAQGRAEGIGGFVIDLTERLRLEEQLHHSQKMEAVGRLAGGIAHDFNNLLTAILGQANLLRLSVETGLPLDVALAAIENAAEKATGLTRQLLDFSRKERRRTSAVDVHETIRSTIGLLSRAVDRRITFEEDLGATEFTVTGDGDQLHQALVNLLVNACDAMPDGGQLTVRTRTIEEARRLSIEVADTGEGIPPEVRSRVFEPFFTTKPEGQGTGMGLAMVYGIVRAHAGTIDLTSTVGVGTSFTIVLPVGDGAADRGDDGEALRTRRGTGVVLLVDDEDVVLDVGEQMLGHLGYEAVLARDGLEAVEVYRQRGGDIALVLLDLVMPRMDGQECLQALRSLDPEVRIVLSSGFDRRGRIGAILERESLPFIQKPYRIETLSEVLANALSS